MTCVFNFRRGCDRKADVSWAEHADKEEGECPRSGSEPPTPAVIFLSPLEERGPMASRGINICGVCYLLLYVITVVLGG